MRDHKPKKYYPLLIVFVFCFNTSLFTQADSVQLHIEGSVQLDKTGPLLSRLILNTVSQNDPGRYGIQFSNNFIAPFLGDDFDHQQFNFYSKWSNNRTYDAIINIHGRAGSDWGRKLSLTHDGDDGWVTTDIGNLILDPGSGGKVGVAIDTPSTKLHVKGDKLRLSSVADEAKYIQFRTDGTALDLDAINAPLYIQSGAFLAMGLGVTNVGIGTDNPGYKLQVGEMGDGTEARANSWVALSDLRWKKNIELITDPLDKIAKLSGYYFSWKNGLDQDRQVGVIAQEVETVLPEIVSTDTHGYKSVDYDKLSALFIEGFKEHQTIIKQQQSQIDFLKEQIELLKERFNNGKEE